MPASTSMGPGLAIPTPSTLSTATPASATSPSTAEAIVRTTSDGSSAVGVEVVDAATTVPARSSST